MTAEPMRARSRRASVSSPILERSPVPLTTIVVAVVVAVVLIIVGFVLRATEPDAHLAQALNQLHVGGLALLTNTVYHVFSPAEAIIITVIVTGIIWWRQRDIRPAAAFAGLVAVTWIPSDIVKIIVHRPRPDVHLLAHAYTPYQVDASYPSGHTVFVTALVIGLVYVLRRTRWERLTIVLGTILVIIVLVSLTIDAVHYPTDVLASVVWALGVAPAARVVWVDWIMARIPFLRPEERRPEERRLVR